MSENKVANICLTVVVALFAAPILAVIITDGGPGAAQAEPTETQAAIDAACYYNATKALYSVIDSQGPYTELEQKNLQYAREQVEAVQGDYWQKQDCTQ